jgi:uncharacterized protein YecT (DUF1311 family)
MKRRSLLALAVLATTAVSAGLVLAGGGASAAPARDSYANCLKHADSTFAMSQCVGAEQRRLKPLLADAYNKLVTDPDSNRRRRHLIAVSQKAWKSYMKHDCIYAGNQAQGGTLQPILEGECQVDRTRTRIADLREFSVPLGR